MRTFRFERVVLCTFALILALATQVGAEESKGKFKNALADKETFVVTVDGAERTFQLGGNAKVLINERQSSLTELKAGDDVTITWQKRDDRTVASLVKCKRE